MTTLNYGFIFVFYKELKLSTFDPALAKAFGFMPSVLFYALLMLTSATAVAAFDAVGAVLFIAFAIVPASVAYLLTDRLWMMFMIGALVSIFSSISGFYLAVHLNVSIGGMMAVMTGACLLLAFLAGPRYGLATQMIKRHRGRHAPYESPH